MRMHEQGGQALFEICSCLAMKHNLALTRQAISQHLGGLEAAGLVGWREAEGRYKVRYLDARRSKAPS